MEFQGTSVDWKVLERTEFTKLSDIWQWCGSGDSKAKNTGLLILQTKKEVEEYLDAIAPLHLYQNRRRANQVTRHVLKVAEKMAAAREEFRKLPATFMKVYEPEIRAAQGHGKKPRIDLAH